MTKSPYSVTFARSALDEAGRVGPAYRVVDTYFRESPIFVGPRYKTSAEAHAALNALNWSRS